jgi:protein-arginine kinase activator protein McsA
LDLIESIQNKIGKSFSQVNVLMVDETNIHELPIEILNQMLDKAVSDENFELATIVRDAINKK